MIFSTPCDRGKSPAGASSRSLSESFSRRSALLPGSSKMEPRRRFPNEILAAISGSKVLRIRAGNQPHRFIGIWVVVVEGRVFVRSWSLKLGGWYRKFLEEPRGAIEIVSHGIPVRAL